jgi:hypothetical protein
VQCVSFTGSGSGYRAHVNFIQDTSNYVQMGIHYEKSLYSRMYIEWGYTKGGSGVGTRLQDTGAGPYDFLITYIGGTARVYLNGVEQGSVSITLSNT